MRLVKFFALPDFSFAGSSDQYSYDLSVYGIYLSGKLSGLEIRLFYNSVKEPGFSFRFIRVSLDDFFSIFGLRCYSGSQIEFLRHFFINLPSDWLSFFEQNHVYPVWVRDDFCESYRLLYPDSFDAGSGGFWVGESRWVCDLLC